MPSSQSQDVLFSSIIESFDDIENETARLDAIGAFLDSTILSMANPGKIISNYRDLAQQEGEVSHRLRARYYEMVWANRHDENKLDSLLSVNNRDALLRTRKFISADDWGVYVKVKMIESQYLERQGTRDASLLINFSLISLLDSLFEVFDDASFHEIQFKNYYSISRHYLFENDDLSNTYADSSLNQANLSGSIINIYKAHSIKYYANYYTDDGTILNAIADSCLAYATIIDDPKVLGEAYMHKCNALVVDQKVDEAFRYCSLAEEEYKKTDDSRFLSSVYNNIANVFGKVEAHDKALVFYVRSLDHAREDPGSEQFLTSLFSVAEKNYAMGNYEKAAHFYHEYSDSITTYYNNQLESQFAEAEQKYLVSEREREIARQELIIERERSTRRIILTGGIALITLLGAGFFALLQWSKRKKKENELALRLEKQRAEDMEELNEIKTDFFNNVSHELRTPLTLVIAPLQDALERVRHVKTQSDLSLALGNAKRLLSLTNEILDLSKMDAGKLVKVESEVNLRKFLRRVFYSFESLAQSKEIHIKTDLSHLENLSVKTDIDKLEKILNNLIGNAIKFGGKHDTVQMMVSQLNPGEHVTLDIQIIDNGPGISQDELDRIFDRFYQSNSGIESAGTGIGLSLVKQFSHFLDGKVDVESEPGKGTKFILQIPVEVKEILDQDIDSDSDEKTLKYSPVLIDGNLPELLVVEDDYEMSKYLSELLKGIGRVTTVYNGKEALQKLKTADFDLITSDVMMPEMNGFEFREKVNEDPRWKDVPFIMLTARIMEEDRLKGFQLGIDDYITKPFSSTEILVRINNLLKNRIARNQYAQDTSQTKDHETNVDSDWLARAEELVLKNLDNPDYDVPGLAKDLTYSKRQLGRKLKKLTGLSPVSFILEIRLQKAYRMIQERRFGTINEVRHDVGISSASYFSRKFKERFGVSPGDLIVG